MGKIVAIEVYNYYAQGGKKSVLTLVWFGLPFPSHFFLGVGKETEIGNQSFCASQLMLQNERMF